mgnify:CR=1 FL=1
MTWIHTQHVKACLPDITQLMVKYNIDSRYFNTAEVENRNKVIQQLLAVIRGLIELPLCKDCRYYTKEEVVSLSILHL